MKSRTLAAWLMGLIAMVYRRSPCRPARRHQKAGVLRVATFDSNPPFGFVDPQTSRIVGLDVDYARALADKLGVKLELQPTNPANRIPFLTSKKVDLVLANFTITDEAREAGRFQHSVFLVGSAGFWRKRAFSDRPIN